jgi:hypothetical protein
MEATPRPASAPPSREAPDPIEPPPPGAKGSGASGSRRFELSVEEEAFIGGMGREASTSSSADLLEGAGRTTGPGSPRTLVTLGGR